MNATQPTVIAVSKLQMVRYRRWDGGYGLVRVEEFDRLAAATRVAEADPKSEWRSTFVDFDGYEIDSFIEPGVFERVIHYAVNFDNGQRVEVALYRDGWRTERHPLAEQARVAVMAD